MINTNITNLKNNTDKFLDAAIRYNEHINVATNNGNAVILSNGILETLYLVSIPNMKDKLLKGKNTSKEECLEINF